MWFWLSLITLVCWSGSDLFSKIGCADARDKYSHLKMVMAVGAVMGLHAAWEIFVGGTEINFSVILTYLPVSALYIVSMALGYVGLRYIELSISSPICNSSGALVAVLTLCVSGIGSLNGWQLGAVALVCVGVVGLGIQQAAPVDSYVTPIPWAMPGYDAEVVMAAGAFVQGSSIELSADGPIRPPYAVYFQGGLTWYHAKLGILLSLQKLVEQGLAKLPEE